MSVAAGILGLIGLSKAEQFFSEQKQKNAQQNQSLQIKGLLGTENQPYLLGADQRFDPGDQIPGLQIEGTGLLGGAGAFDPTNQVKFAGGLMQIPGMQQIGSSMLTGAQDREQRGQFKGKDMVRQNGIQLAKNLAQREKDDLEEMQRLENFGFKDQAQFNSALNSWQAQHDKQVAPLRDALYKYKNVQTRLAVAGNNLDKLSGTDDLMITRAFIKMMNGGREAFMSDDQQAALMAAQGFGTYDQLLNMITGQGSLDADGRGKMLDVMNTMAIQLQGSLEGERALIKRKMDYFGVPNDLVMRDNIDTIDRKNFNAMIPLTQKQKRAALQKRISAPMPRTEPPPPPGVQWQNTGKVIRDAN